MNIYRWELLTVCHHPGKCCEHRHCDSGDIVFLNYHVTSREDMFKGLCEFMGGCLSRRVTTFLCLVIISLVQVEI